MKCCKREKNKAFSAFFYSNSCFTKTENAPKEKRTGILEGTTQKDESMLTYWWLPRSPHPDKMQPPKHDAHHLLEIFPKSYSLSATQDAATLKYNRATDSFNGVKCATVQLHPQWYTDLSGKSPKSGQFCTQGKWTTVAQTDLISVWFTTSNHLMSRCHIHIIHSFVFLSKNYNKSVKKGEHFGL